MFFAGRFAVGSEAFGRISPALSRESDASEFRILREETGLLPSSTDASPGDEKTVALQPLSFAASNGTKASTWC